ncbi:MAG: TraB/GumN family protein [Bacteroidota bacterium]
MKYIIPILLSFFLLSCAAKKKAITTAETTSQEVSKQIENSLLWRISGKDLKEPSYLYGTIHLISKDDYFLTDPTKVAFEEAQRIVFEINMEDMSDMSIVFSLMGKIMMNNGTTLKDLLNEEDYALVEKKFQSMGLPLAFLGKIKPMFLSTFASGDMSAGGLSNGKMVSYEMEFLTLAQEAKKEVDGLETIEFQLSMFDSIPYEAQAQMLVDAIKNTDTGNDQFKDMVELYKKQDLSGMQDMFASEEGGLGNYEDLLLAGRNRNWIPIMAKMMTEKKTFFAVGAGHLGGDVGVVSLLRKEGYKVEPIKKLKKQ